MNSHETSGHPTSALRLAVSANGTGRAVWAQNDVTAESIFINRYDGAAWAASGTRIDDLDGSAASPHIGIDQSGNAYAAWVQFDGARNSIYVVRYDSADGWGAPVMLDDPALGEAKEPWVTINPGGEAIIIWSQEPGDGSLEYSLHASRLD